MDQSGLGINWGSTRKRKGITCEHTAPLPNPPCAIPSGCCSFTGPWTVTRSSLRMLRRVAVFCRPLRPVLFLVSFPCLRSPVVGVLGLCWLRRDVPFERQPPPPPYCLFRDWAHFFCGADNTK